MSVKKMHAMKKNAISAAYNSSWLHSFKTKHTCRAVRHQQAPRAITYPGRALVATVTRKYSVFLSGSLFR